MVELAFRACPEQRRRASVRATYKFKGLQPWLIRVSSAVQVSQGDLGLEFSQEELDPGVSAVMVLLQPKLSLRVSQKQILTPGLVQMVSVLALNKLELADMINTELTENPVLE